MSTPVTQRTIIGVFMSSQTSLLSYLFMPASYLMLLATAATSDPSLFLWGVGVYCRGPGICRQQIQPINISAIIPLDSFWGFIVRRTVNGVEGTQGHVRQALMVCLSRLWFKQPIYPKYLRNNRRQCGPWTHVYPACPVLFRSCAEGLGGFAIAGRV